MFKKLLPFMLIAFISACSHTPTTSTGTTSKPPCCEKCECCKDGMCKMCMAKHKGSASTTTQNDEVCPMCKKEKEEMMKRHQGMKH